MKREFIYQDDRSNKFWTVERCDSQCVTTYGRMGAAPRETRKDLGTEDAAQRECDRLVAQKLKEGYTECAMAEAPAYTKPDWASMSMSEDVFWRLIGLLNWRKTGDDDAVVAPLVAALSQMSVADIGRFEELLARKLFALDTEAHAREIGESSYGSSAYFSPDWFLYVRCCAVANGRAYYEAALADPRKMPKDTEFEALLAVADEAHQRKLGAQLEPCCTCSYETFSNTDGWAGVSSPSG